MSYYTYILFSQSSDRFYKGSTENLILRIARHNAGKEISTRAGKPWVLIWSQQHITRSSAMVLEKKIKNLSRERTIRFIDKYNIGICKDEKSLTLLSLWGVRVSDD